MDILEYIQRHTPTKKFQPGVIVDVANRAVDIFLEDVSFYAEWLKGEGADMAVYRAQDDDRVVGARLPLRVWNGKFPVEILGDNS